MDLIPLNTSVVGFNLIWLWDRLDQYGGYFDLLLEYCERGILQPHVGAEYEWEELKKALRELQSGRTVGKVVVKGLEAASK